MARGSSKPSNRRVLSVASARELDRRASAEFGLSTLVFMEHAALGLRERVLRRLDGQDKPVAILCGPGNNGGDGLALARLLDVQGITISVLLGVDPGSLKGDAAAQFKTLAAMGVTVLEPNAQIPAPGIVVDAILGTGLSRAPEGGCRMLIERALGWRQAGAWVIAADVPSGLDADSGRRWTPCVQADETVTFAAAKPGLLAADAAGVVGELVVADLGIPRSLLEDLTTELVAPPGRLAGDLADRSGDSGSVAPDECTHRTQSGEDRSEGRRSV